MVCVYRMWQPRALPSVENHALTPLRQPQWGLSRPCWLKMCFPVFFCFFSLVALCWHESDHLAKALRSFSRPKRIWHVLRSGEETPVASGCPQAKGCQGSKMAMTAPLCNLHLTVDRCERQRGWSGKWGKAAGPFWRPFGIGCRIIVSAVVAGQEALTWLVG